MLEQWNEGLYGESAGFLIYYLIFDDYTQIIHNSVITGENMNNRSLMNVLKLSLFLILSGALSACAVKDELVGSRWVVVGKIDVPPNAFGVYFQNGKPVAQNQVDRFQPWCEVSFADKSSSFRSLEGGAYEISRLTYDNN